MGDAALESAIEEFRAAERWLFSLVTDPEGKRYFAEKTAAQREIEFAAQMARTADFLAFAGHPEAKFRGVHIAGTSGKGSVTQMVAALLRAAGARVGQHTSPYLQLPLEKLVVDGRWIRPSEFAQLVRDFRALHEQWGAGWPNNRLRYGEAWVALTFMWLAQQQVAWGVVETGMGGRFDPTNALPAELAIITNVGWDHEKVLGPTLRDIAWHKAGIIKRGQTVVTAVAQPDLLAVVKGEAADKGARLLCLGEDFDYEVTGDGMLAVSTPFGRFEGVHQAGRAGFQQHNAALALAAVAAVAPNLTAEAASMALQSLAHPGRFEVVGTRPTVVLDGAHNPHKMAALAAALGTAFQGKKITAVLGAIVNKDVEKMLIALLPVVSRVVTTQPHVAGKPAIAADVLAQAVLRLAPGMEVVAADEVLAAVGLALAEAKADEVIVITGSLYLVGEARNYWFPVADLLRAAEVDGREQT